MYAQHYFPRRYLVANLVVVVVVVYHPPPHLQADALVDESSLSCVVPLFRVALSPLFYQVACLDDDTSSTDDNTDTSVSVYWYDAALFSFAHLLQKKQ